MLRVSAAPGFACLALLRDGFPVGSRDARRGAVPPRHNQPAGAGFSPAAWSLRSRHSGELCRGSPNSKAAERSPYRQQNDAADLHRLTAMRCNRCAHRRDLGSTRCLTTTKLVSGKEVFWNKKSHSFMQAVFSYGDIYQVSHGGSRRLEPSGWRMHCAALRVI